MPESQPTPSMANAQPACWHRFGVEDRPPCPSCGVEKPVLSFPRARLPWLRSAEFSCMKCDAEITRSADRMGKPHLQAVLIDLEEPQGIARGMSE